jgi:hypothetical protein
MSQLECGWFFKVMEFLPTELRDRAVIAGGFAADHERAQDVDVWVLNGRNGSFEAREQIEEFLVNNFQELELVRNLGLYPDSNVVATLKRAFLGHDVQLLTTGAFTTKELVNGFDISTHQVALQQVGELMKVTHGDDWTSLHEQPRVTRFSTPADTLRRLHKVTQRYGTQPRKQDIERLIWGIRDETPNTDSLWAERQLGAAA